MTNKIDYHPGTLPFLISLLILILVFACDNDPVNVEGDELLFSRGVFIVNEGVFLSDNASLSFYDPVLDTVYNQVFFQANQSTLGDVANSMTIWNDRGYIPINNSGRVYIVDPASMEFLGKITNLTSPRYLEVVDANKAYVTDLYDRKISVVHPTEYNLMDSIGIDIGGEFNQHAAEELIITGGKAFAACWSYDNKILVIDTHSDRLVDSIQVGKQPNSMVLDHEGDIWVLCDGGYTDSPYGQEEASLWRVDTQTLDADLVRKFDDLFASPSDLCINATGDTLFYLNGAVYYVDLSNPGSPGRMLAESGGKWFYSLSADPYDNIIYAGDAVDFQSNGWVYRYSTGGALLDSFQVGINPGHFCFIDRNP